jgi:hypothetical protein
MTNMNSLVLLKNILLLIVNLKNRKDLKKSKQSGFLEFSTGFLPFLMFTPGRR